MASRDETTLDPRTRRLQVIANDALRRLAEKESECGRLRWRLDAATEALWAITDRHPDAAHGEHPAVDIARGALRVLRP